MGGLRAAKTSEALKTVKLQPVCYTVPGPTRSPSETNADIYFPVRCRFAVSAWLDDGWLPAEMLLPQGIDYHVTRESRHLEKNQKYYQKLLVARFTANGRIFPMMREYAESGLKYLKL